jgi:acyl-coenzyme A synthetase/AMP-(fatty) acid ligase
LEASGRTWFKTGDEVWVDSDGYVFYRGRNDDIINTSGYRVGPQEVENALNSHPAIKESAVVGRRDPKRGEVIEAHLVLNEGFLPSDMLAEEIQNHVKSVTAPYKYPRRIEFTDALPKTATGKIKRSELRKSGSST